jgi:transcriptional regulator with XRE-family HTH domain
MPVVKEDSNTLRSSLKIVGEKLYELRVSKGYSSHADFASANDLPRIQYWRMEKGYANITFKSLHRVLSIHGLTIEQLFEMILYEKSKRKKGKRSGLLKKAS